LAERALAAVPDGDGALATVNRERSLFLRYARSRPTQSTAVDDLSVEVAVLRDGHVGRSATNGTDADALRDCAVRAADAAAEAARSGRAGSYPGFPRPGAARPQHSYDPETARLDPALGGAALRTAFAAAESAGVEAHGAWTAGEVDTAVASSAGGVVSERVTDAFMKVVCIAPSGRSGYAAATGSALRAIAPGALAERAAAKAAVAGEPVVLEPGEHTVVMEPHALGLLLEELGSCAFNGLAHAEGRGALSGRLGDQVVSPQVNISDSPRYRGTLPRAFDAEGTPKRPVPLIQDGVAHRVVHDTRSAVLAGTATTGHALEPGGSPQGPEPTNLVMIGGGAADEDELCAPVERGVYVTRLWYQNLVHPTESLVTAVTRDGTFLIEDGRLTRPLADVRLTDSVLGILARAEALSRRPILTSEGEFYGRRFATGTVCPAIRAGGVGLSRSSAG
jgi:predicted Zn-dependent protease